MNSNNKLQEYVDSLTQSATFKIFAPRKVLYYNYFNEEKEFNKQYFIKCFDEDNNFCERGGFEMIDVEADVPNKLFTITVKPILAYHIEDESKSYKYCKVYFDKLHKTDWFDQSKHHKECYFCRDNKHPCLSTPYMSWEPKNGETEVVTYEMRRVS
jgi:hypothetical protein